MFLFSVTSECFYIINWFVFWLNISNTIIIKIFSFNYQFVKFDLDRVLYAYDSTIVDVLKFKNHSNISKYELGTLYFSF